MGVTGGLAILWGAQVFLCTVCFTLSMWVALGERVLRICGRNAPRSLPSPHCLPPLLLSPLKTVSKIPQLACGIRKIWVIDQSGFKNVLSLRLPYLAAFKSVTKDEYFKLCSALVEEHDCVHLGHCIIFCYSLGSPPDMAGDAVQY